MSRLTSVVFFFAALASQLFASRRVVVDTSPTMLDGRPAVLSVYSDGSTTTLPLVGCAECGPYIGLIGLNKILGEGNGERLGLVAMDGRPNNGAGNSVVQKGQCELVQNVCTPSSVHCIFDAVVEFTIRDAAGNRLMVPISVADYMAGVVDGDMNGRVTKRWFTSDTCNGLRAIEVLIVTNNSSWELTVVVGCNPCVGVHPGQAI